MSTELANLIREVLDNAPGNDAERFILLPHALAESGWYKRARAALAASPRAEGAGVPFCYVTYRACTELCPSREECLLRWKPKEGQPAAPVAEKREQPVCDRCDGTGNEPGLNRVCEKCGGSGGA